MNTILDNEQCRQYSSCNSLMLSLVIGRRLKDNKKSGQKLLKKEEIPTLLTFLNDGYVIDMNGRPLVTRQSFLIIQKEYKRKKALADVTIRYRTIETFRKEIFTNNILEYCKYI